jgi:micrococcal nuclease
MRYKTFLIVFLLLITINGCVNHTGNKKEGYKYYTVVRVIDGDTFWLDDGSDESLRVRLIGIDAPESRDYGSKIKGYYGEEAKEYLTKLIRGKKVRLEFDVERFDQYDRTLAYVYLEDGTFVNAELVKNGYAMTMTFPPNVRYTLTFLKLAREARKKKSGLWGEKIPE